MSGISFSSSASQQLGNVVVESFPFPVTPDVIAALAAVDPGLVPGYLKSAFSAYHAVVRGASSEAGSSVEGSSTPVSVVSSVSSSGGSGKFSRYKEIRAKASWRGVALPGPEVSGYCYLKAILPGARETAARSLGQWPSFFELLSYDGSAYASDSELKQLRVSGDAVSAHLGFGTDGLSFEDVMVEVASKSRPAITSSSVYHRFVGREPVGPSKFIGTTSLGGSVLKEWLSGILLEGQSLDDERLRLVSRSAALLDADGKRSLRSLEALGDAVISLLIAQDNYLRAGSAERYQNLRSYLTNNKVLAEKFVEFFPAGAVQFVGGVSPTVGVVGAKAFESVVGALWLDVGSSGVVKLLQHVGLLDFEMLIAE